MGGAHEGATIGRERNQRTRRQPSSGLIRNSNHYPHPSQAGTTPPGCIRLTPEMVRQLASLADGERADSSRLCALFGGPLACLQACASLGRAPCWMAYLDALLPAVPGGRVGAWMLLQEARSICDQNEEHPCASLEAELFVVVEREVLMQRLCDPRCAWPHDLPPAAFGVAGIGRAADKPHFCARTLSGKFCSVALHEEAWSLRASDERLLLEPGARTNPSDAFIVQRSS